MTSFAQITVFAVMLSMGMALGFEGMGRLWRRPSLLLRCCLAAFVVVPVAAMVVTRVLPLSFEVRAGIAAMAVIPGAPFIYRKMLKGPGDAELAGSFQATMALLSILLVPLWFGIISALYPNDAAAPLATVFKQVMLMQGVPLLAGAAIAPASLAQTVDAAPAPQGLAVLLTQATDADDQPASPDDLAVEDLTNEQITQLETVFDTYQPQIEAATARYLTSLETINALLVPSTDDLTLTNAHNDVVVAEQAMNELIFQRNLALRSVLTLDQRQVINDYVRAYLGLAAPPQVTVTFPDTLVGLDADAAIANLQADDWGVAFTTPSQVGLNRGSEELDLLGINLSRSKLILPEVGLR
ncbi:MAG: hypothetical protein HC929_16100 [Leptolyngbyaceae cyanobacterium SM2_5_2]|nr:hypothetical protein [Leptolyngbyaceae cyanobacterium SM2_5_2]